MRTWPNYGYTVAYVAAPTTGANPSVGYLTLTGYAPSVSSGSASNMVIAVAQAMAGNTLAAQGTAITASVVANRTSGVAPLSVHLDCSATTAAGITSLPFHELYYVHYYGDDVGGTWAYGNKPGVALMNIGIGPIGAHVFKTPGTKTIKTTIFHLSSSGTLSIAATISTTITISDPATVYAGAATICVANGTLPVAGVNGVPAGATCVNSADLTAISALVNGNNKRLLFKKGDSWSTVAGNFLGLNIGAYSGLTIGAYGASGVAPKIMSSATAQNFTRCVLVSDTANDVRVMDIEVDGSNTPQANDHSQVTGTAAISGNAPFFTVLNVYAHDLGGFFLGGGDSACLSESYFNNGQGGSGCVGIWLQGASNYAILGCKVSNCTNIEHCMRLQGASIGVVSNTTSTDPGNLGSTRHAFALRGYLVAAGPGNWGGLYSEKNVISDCLFSGLGGLICQFDASASAFDERLRNNIFERNYVYAVGGGNCISTATISDFSIRSNVLTSDSGTAISISHSTSVGTPAPTNHYVNNNTFYSGTTTSFLPLWVVDGSGGGVFSGISIVNNLAYAPNTVQTVFGSGDFTNYGFFYDQSGTATLSHNSTGTQTHSTAPGFTIPPTATLSTWTPVSGYGNNAGIYVPVFDDVMMAVRTGSNDLGAVNV